MAKNENGSGAKQKRFNGSFLLLLLLLGGTLAVLCRQGFRPYEVFWANDIPLGPKVASSSRLPGAIFVCWVDFFWIGGPNVAFPPNLSNFCMALLSPAHQLKFYAPGSMLFLGFGAWFFFRRLRFAPMVCVLGGLGAGLNMHFLSNACWGLGQWNVCCGMIFIALGILVSSEIRLLWLKGALAGLSTGMAVMEGFDNGAILSIYVGIFLAFLFLTANEDPLARRAGKTLLVGGLVVISAVLISLSTIYTLVVTQISGTTSGGQSEGDKEARWQFITQWSIPKVESLRVIIPGLFGYRMQEFTTSTNKAGSYWGQIAEDPRIGDLESSDPQARSNAVVALGISPQPELQAIFASNDMAARTGYLEQIQNQVQRRHTGNGEYAGVLVCLLAAFGLANAGRKAGSAYSAEERRAVWFWGGAALFSLLAAWGRYGFVYPLIYHLPFLTNIRSPMKFMHPLNISLIILAGYGLETLYRRYLSRPAPRPGARPQTKLNWWQRASDFDKKWVIGSGIVLIAAAAGFFMVRSSQPDITHYLEHNGFDDADLAGQIARFCTSEVGLFVIYLALSAGLVIVIISGALAGQRAIWAWVCLSAIMICDLYRADAPWIRYYNYKEKYSPNPVAEILEQKPWEHRVVSRTSPIGPYDLSGDANFGGLNHWWLENDFPFHDIQSLEIDQAPRMPVLDGSYLGNFLVRSRTDLSPATRLWQLTNTRYILADSSMEAALNQSGEPKNSFRTVLRMELAVKPGVTQFEDAGDLTVKTNSQGTLALFEFARALPRAKLFSHWQVMEDSAALQTLASPQFDPEKTVLVAKETPLSQTPGQTEADPGTVEITQYESKNLILQADAKTPAVLLLNDHTGDSWYVWVDQTPGTVLRCNDIMQGVFVPPGRHTIEFRYQPPQSMLRVSLSAFALGILLGGYVLAARFAGRPQAPAPAVGNPSPVKPKGA
jgi:hypothetical protein